LKIKIANTEEEIKTKQFELRDLEYQLREQLAPAAHGGKNNAR
jgi:hypothetical protein